MNMISQLREKVLKYGKATVSINDYNQLQAEWITRQGIETGWIQVDSPEDIPITGDEVLCFDGCDISIDYVEYDSENGASYMANGTEVTHYMPLPPKPATNENA